MSIGFSSTTLDIIELPQEIPLYLPYAVDDCSLAFHLGFRNKIVWYAIHKKQEMYRVLSIKKKSGGKRLIHAPTPLFKLMLQQFLNKFLTPLQELLGDHVTAYREGCSTRDAVEQHIPKCDVCEAAKGAAPEHTCPRLGTYVHMDLENFFGSTLRSWIRNYFKGLGYSHYVAGLMASLITVKVGDKNIVPQGAPTSGAICNLVADQRLDWPIRQFLGNLDRTMNLSGEYSWRYTRYSDDLSFTCGKTLTQEEQEEFIGGITKIVRAGGYRVNKAKTRGTFRYHAKRLLGLVMNQKPNVDQAKYLKFRGVVHNCLMYGLEVEAEKSGKTPEAFRSWVQGNVNYIGQIHPAHGEKLMDVLRPAIEIWKHGK